MTRVHQAYVVETIGSIEGCGCANCSSGSIGDAGDPSIIDQAADALRQKVAEAEEAVQNIVTDLRQRAADLQREVRNALPATPDPIPPALDVAGPTGWGSYVAPSVLVLAALGAAGFLYLRGKHARSRPGSSRRARHA